MKPAGLKTTEPRNSTDHRSGLSLSVARGNSYQVWWAPDAFGLIRKKEETPELIQKENRSEDPAKPRILNRQLSMHSGTLLRSPRLKVTTCPPTSGDAHRGLSGQESRGDGTGRCLQQPLRSVPFQPTKLLGPSTRRPWCHRLLDRTRRSIDATGPGVDDAVILNFIPQAWHSDPLLGPH